MADRFGGTAVITIFILSLLVVTIAAWWTVSRRRRMAQARFDNLPLLAVPAVPGHIARPSYSAPDLRPHPTTILGSREATPYHEGYRPSTPSSRSREGDVSTIAPPLRPFAATAAEEDEGHPVDGASVRYWRAADGTLQFLPGRLELAAGRDAGQEIRFVRTAGPDGTTVTFGRAEGEPYRHVQLREPTVSRSHARMSLESGHASPDVGELGAPQGARWRLENLSATNPVIVNGRALAADSGPRSSVILSDGDRIEMGEVAFIFRAR
ncbi:MAG TPA: FHA domain-containing protein [Gemmatimonadaceae bacterium]|nr:FHA domain-containing protein [Gemmatimonadaceae bacterium]